MSSRGLYGNDLGSWRISWISIKSRKGWCTLANNNIFYNCVTITDALIHLQTNCVLYGMLHRICTQVCYVMFCFAFSFIIRCYWVYVVYLYIVSGTASLALGKSHDCPSARAVTSKHAGTLIARFMGPTWDLHGTHLGPTGPRWAPCWPHEPCYQGKAAKLLLDTSGFIPEGYRLDYFTVPLHRPSSGAVQKDCQWLLKNSHRSCEATMQWDMRQSHAVIRPTNLKRVMPANWRHRICTQFCYFVLFLVLSSGFTGFMWYIYQYSPALLHWHWGNPML